MIGDFDETHAMEMPQFAFLLGDIVYNFGESAVLLRPVLRAVPQLPRAHSRAAGNHDGMVSPLAHATSLDAYLRNFCSDPARISW